MKKKSFSELVVRCEKSGLQFYRDCMRITNQFSTKYILEKVIQKQRKHVTRLLADIGNVYDSVAEAAALEKKLQIFLQKELVREFDRENLNFVEVTKLAIRMTSFYRDMYMHLKENESLKNLHPVIDHIIESKSMFINQLTSELERLSYDQS